MEVPEEWPSNPQGGTEPGLQALWLFSFCDKKMPGREPPGRIGMFFSDVCCLLFMLCNLPHTTRTIWFFSKAASVACSVVYSGACQRPEIFKAE